MPTKVPTQQRLRELFDYDAETGALTWRHRPDMRSQWNVRYAGKVAGSINADGYLVIKIDSRSYFAHRLVWVYLCGDVPDEIDLINGVKADTRIANLRLATSAQNAQNRRMSCSNTSGFKGVSWNKQTAKWRAQLGIGPGRNKHLGRFDTAEEASLVYQAAAREHFGEFARTS
jgi:HNH endonuclease/AP2 domain